MASLSIIILTRLPSGYSEKRLFSVATERGHDVQVLKFTNISLVIEGESSNRLINGDVEIDKVDAVIPRLFSGSGDYGISVLRQFELMGAYTPNKSLAITRANQTIRALQIMSSKGIVIPKTIVARGSDRLAQHLDEINIPFLLQRAGDGDMNHMIVESKRTANSMISVLGSTNEIFIAQEFDQSAQNIVYTAMVVGKSIVASVKVNKLANESKAVPYHFSDIQRKVLYKAVKSMGLAVCQVELIDGANGPEVIGIRANPDIEFFEKITTRDVAIKVIEYIERNAKQRNKKDRIGA